MSEADVTETTLRVRYAETDAMGVVYHTNYIVWFEVGRGDFLRQKGGNYKHVEDAGIYLPVTEVDARFVAAAQYDDEVLVRTSVEELRSRTVTMYYEVVKKDSGQLLVSGHTKHLCVDREGKVQRIPRALVEVFSPGSKADAGTT